MPDDKRKVGKYGLSHEQARELAARIGNDRQKLEDSPLHYDRSAKERASYKNPGVMRQAANCPPR
jgi:hypothetical protein